MQKQNWDDVDDFMAGLLGGSRPAPRPQPSPRPSDSTHAKQPRRHPSAPSLTPKPKLHTQPMHSPQPKRRAPATPQRRPSERIEQQFSAPAIDTPSTSNKGLRNGILFVTCIAIVLSGGFFLWKGPIAAMLEPKSPFSQEQQDNMDIPLYFPAKLPGTFKIELNSISQSESGVLLYAITDDTGKQINVTLQKQPDGIDLTPLYQRLDNLQETETKFGTVRVGRSEDNIFVANVLTGSTWVIITSYQNVLTPEVLQTIINNLRV